MQINSAKELTVYKAAYQLAMEIFDLSKRFPPEERFALTSQIRRSSRSVCLNLREAWAKRRYEAHFTSKLTDCDGENSEKIPPSISQKTASTLVLSRTRNLPDCAKKSAKCWEACYAIRRHSLLSTANEDESRLFPEF